MTYCWKCGTKLDEEAKYCHVCGAAVGTPSPGQPPPPPSAYRPRRGWPIAYTLAIVLGSILIVGVIAGFFFYLPVRPVSFNKYEQVFSQVGATAANFNFSADIATFNVTFSRLDGTLMTMNVTANGGVGLIVPSALFNVTMEQTRIGNGIFVDARVVRESTWWPWMGGLSVVCDVHIDESLNTTLKVKTDVGRISLDAPRGAILDSLELETTTGQAEATLEQGVIINGLVRVQSTTGSSSLSWDNVKLAGDVQVDVRTTTGSVQANVTQDSLMRGNVALDAETVTGSARLNLTIHSGVGAVITSSTSFGGVSTNLTGFSGAKSPWQSNDYPASSNFIIVLKTTTGGINIQATYESQGHM
jgi:hypothetical protein